MTTWHERLHEAMEKSGVSAADLSRATGISPAGIKKWIDGVTQQPRYDDVEAACKILGVTTQWLMTGAEHQGNAIPVDWDDCVMLEMLKFGKEPSKASDEENPESIPFPRQWFLLQFPHSQPENVKVMTAAGDAMSPLIDDHESVFVDTADCESIREGVYLLLVDGEPMIRRIERLPKQVLRLSCHNPAYSSLDIQPNGDISVKIIGRVLKVLKMQLL